jgi:hypothetical protein
MSKYILRILITGCAAALLCSPAQAGTIYSISPANVFANPGDVGDSFDVLLTNSGTSDISIAAFSFEVSVTNPDITLTGADFSTGANPYIFATDSFDAINGFTLNTTSPGQTLDAGDVTNDGAGITLAPGQSLALGDVLFNVANGTASGSYTVSFSGGADFNNLSGPAGNAINVDSFSSGTIFISSVATVPEPVSALPLAGALIIGVLVVRKRGRRLHCGGDATNR